MPTIRLHLEPDKHAKGPPSGGGTKGDAPGHPFRGNQYGHADAMGTAELGRHLADVHGMGRAASGLSRDDMDAAHMYSHVDREPGSDHSHEGLAPQGSNVPDARPSAAAQTAEYLLDPRGREDYGGHETGNEAIHEPLTRAEAALSSGDSATAAEHLAEAHEVASMVGGDEHPGSMHEHIGAAFDAASRGDAEGARASIAAARTAIDNPVDDPRNANYERASNAVPDRPHPADMSDEDLRGHITSEHDMTGKYGHGDIGGASGDDLREIHDEMTHDESRNAEYARASGVPEAEVVGHVHAWTREGKSAAGAKGDLVGHPFRGNQYGAVEGALHAAGLPRTGGASGLAEGWAVEHSKNGEGATVRHNRVYSSSSMDRLWSPETTHKIELGHLERYAQAVRAGGMHAEVHDRSDEHNFSAHVHVPDAKEPPMNETKSAAAVNHLGRADRALKSGDAPQAMERIAAAHHAAGHDHPAAAHLSDAFKKAGQGDHEGARQALASARNALGSTVNIPASY